NTNELTREKAVGADHTSSCQDISESGVRYADGGIKVAATDVKADGFGTPWGQTRTWTNTFNPVYAWTGSGTLVPQQPYLVQNGTGLVVVLSSEDSIYFDNVGGMYT